MVGNFVRTNLYYLDKGVQVCSNKCGSDILSVNSWYPILIPSLVCRYNVLSRGAAK